MKTCIKSNKRNVKWCLYR